MGQETVTYLTNIVICTILACLMTHYWLCQGRASAMRYWMMAAWVMTLADLLFALRPTLPYAVGRTVPTLLVTIGHAMLFLGAQRTAGLRLQRRLIYGVVGLHAPHWCGLGGQRRRIDAVAGLGEAASCVVAQDCIVLDEQN